MSEHIEVELLIKDAKLKDGVYVFKGVIPKVSSYILPVYWNTTSCKYTNLAIHREDYMKYVYDVGIINTVNYIYIVDASCIIEDDGSKRLYEINKIYDAILIEKEKVSHD